MKKRRKTQTIHIADIGIGSAYPLVIQSMCNTKTEDVYSTLHQLHQLHAAGAQISRLAVPNQTAASALPAIIKGSPLPLVADIHFDHRLALAAIKAGIAALRINPGNIGDKPKIKELALAARAAGIPIRIGVNAGSVRHEQWQEFSSRPQAMVNLALRDAEILEDMGFSAIKISLKSSDIPEMLAAYRMIAGLCAYPLHIGATEAGTLLRGSIKNALGCGILLDEGIGDTLRVSLTEDPVKEVEAARDILSMLGLRQGGWVFVSCPTCGRTEIDIISLAQEVEQLLSPYQPPLTLKIAVMGCAVNGPGEAADADLGIAASGKGAVLFAKGEKLGFYPEAELLDQLLIQVKKLISESHLADKA